jgi:hypothetical protein
MRTLRRMTAGRLASAIAAACLSACGPAPQQQGAGQVAGPQFDAKPADAWTASDTAAEDDLDTTAGEDVEPRADAQAEPPEVEADQSESAEETAPLADSRAVGDAAAADSADADEVTGADAADVVWAEVAMADTVVADAAAPWKPPLGGTPGSGCAGQEGTLACSADGKFRVECYNGAWMAQQHCGFGVCSAQLSAGGAVITSCGVPATQKVALNSACARYTQCFGGVSHEACVRANLAGAAWKGSFVSGSTQAVPLVAMAHLQGNLDCAAQATTCGQLAECIYLFATPTCQAATSGCEGQVAWQCQGSTALGANCAMLGMKCAVIQGLAQCVQAPACAEAGSVTCNGTIASQCVASSDGKNHALTRDCSVTGGGCKAAVATLASACSGPPPATCEVQGFAAGCVGGKTKNCKSGVEQLASCPWGTTCAVQNSFELLLPDCPAGETCLQAGCSEGGGCAMTARCKGSEVWFCEAKQPASFDCKTIGASCQVTAAGAHCK